MLAATASPVPVPLIDDPTLPHLYRDVAHATAALNGNPSPDPASLTLVADGAVINLAPAMAHCLADTISRQRPELLARAVGYIRDAHLPITVTSLVEGNLLRITPVTITTEAAARLTLRQLHDELLARFWMHFNNPPQRKEA